jgi:hypothetical protein
LGECISLVGCYAIQFSLPFTLILGLDGPDKRVIITDNAKLDISFTAAQAA